MNTHELTHYLPKDHTPISIYRTPQDPTPFPAIYQKLITIDVIHDGVYLPPDLMIDKHGTPISKEIIQESFIIERDWGANLVAERIAKRLGLGSYCSVNTARCLLDFGRFPGSTRPGATHLGRFAINQPLISPPRRDKAT